MPYIIRSIKVNDEPFLWKMLDQALFISPDATPLPKEIIFQPELAKYVQNWGVDEDKGLIAGLKDGRTLVGAVWLRMFKSSNPGYGYINDSTPELSIAVLPKYRGQGVGTELLTKLFSLIRNQYSAVSLSVSPNNPAFRLYCRLGFKVGDLKYFLSLVDGFFGGGENNFAENETWTVVCSMGQVLMLVFMSS